MTDLVERLRKLSAHLDRVGDAVHSPTCDEAATALEAKDKELEALRDENKKLQACIDLHRGDTMSLSNEVDHFREELALSEVRAETAERRVAELEGMLSPESDHPTRNVGLLYQQARAETAERKLTREREAFQRHEQTLRDNGIASHSEAVVLVTTLRRVFDDILDELGCERDNEAALEAIATLRCERDQARAALKPMIPLAEDTAKKLRQYGSPMAVQIEQLAESARRVIKAQIQEKV